MFIILIVKFYVVFGIGLHTSAVTLDSLQVLRIICGNGHAFAYTYICMFLPRGY